MELFCRECSLHGRTGVLLFTVLANPGGGGGGGGGGGVLLSIIILTYDGQPISSSLLMMGSLACESIPGKNGLSS